MRAKGRYADVLYHLAGMIVWVSGILYLLGWIEATSFYGNLGAPWVLSPLSPAQIMSGSADAMMPFRLVLLTCLFYLLGEKSVLLFDLDMADPDPRRGRRSFFSTLAPSGWIAPMHQLAGLRIGTAAFSVVGALVGAELMQALVGRNGSGPASIGDSIHTPFGAVILVAPFFVGLASARLDMVKWS